MMRGCINLMFAGREERQNFMHILLRNPQYVIYAKEFCN